MTTPRLPTVYDFSSLRLHTDGTSVRQSERNINLRYSKLTVRDPRGNWIARDAGGLANVPQRYKARAVSERESDGENVPNENDRSNEELADAETRHYKTSRAEARAEKRRKFTHDFDFLTPVTTTSRSGSASPSRLEPPSSDLLKCIHHLASRFYDKHGQLSNSSREYRKERKTRRLARLAKQRQDLKSKRDRQRDSDASDIDSEITSGSETVEHSDRSTEDDDNDTFPDETSSLRSTKGKVARRKQNRFTDMYKAMDGSALMIIGMLLQEHVSENLQPRIRPESTRPAGEEVHM
ncbi:hypothetical protein VKT23_011812 [Stygiomarasmius scandens]|uniref:Uncharacterized protein n=1 Tax=Marasmiellus scandens TaxID=2682957 RepID=A0ABR1J8W1_9AGAR